MLEQPPAWQSVEKLRLQRSDLGIASFVQAIVFAGMVIFSLCMAAVAVAGNPQALDSEGALCVLIGLTVLTGVGVGLSGFVLGVAALLQRGRQRTWAIMGTILNATGLLLMGSLLALGFLMQS